MTPGFSAQAGDRLGVPMRPSLSRGAAQLCSWPGWRIPAPEPCPQRRRRDLRR